MGKGCSLQEMVLGKLAPYVTAYTKINSKCIEDLNVGPEIENFQKEMGKVVDNLLDFGLLNYFLDLTPKSKTTIKKN